MCGVGEILISEECVLCGIETKYDNFDHIDDREHYVEGAGQLCEKCWKKTYDD
tara:strand:+ start:1407 stop:1565 length:159 start_codon:yes stop_codon:yes gene_type:complete